MNGRLKKLVLQSYKQLHRTRLKVFKGDERTLEAARLRINDEYRKNKHVTNDEAIHTMLKLSKDVEYELRTQVIQAKEVKPGVYEARITEDTVKLENLPFNDQAIPEKGIPGNKMCCQEQTQIK